MPCTIGSDSPVQLLPLLLHTLEFQINPRTFTFVSLPTSNRHPFSAQTSTPSPLLFPLRRSNPFLWVAKPPEHAAEDHIGRQLPPDFTTETENRRLKATGFSPIKLQTLNDYSESYGNVVDLLGDSVGAVLDMKYNEVNSWVTAAMSNVDSCEQTCSGSVENLSQKNFQLSQLCNNALTLIKLASTPN